MQPKFVVCDEAVSALDVSIQAQIINLLKDLKEQQNLTYLFITHDLSVVKYISDRIGVMYLGNIVELAQSQDIFDHPLHPYTEALLDAIPTMEEDSNREPLVLEGDIPSPVNPPAGCKFHTRCKYCTEICTHVVPELTEVGRATSWPATIRWVGRNKPCACACLFRDATSVSASCKGKRWASRLPTARPATKWRKATGWRCSSPR